MNFPKEKFVAFLGIAKVVIAGYGVFASVRNLVDSVKEVKTGRNRKVVYVDAGNIPAEKMDDYLAEADRYLSAEQAAEMDDEASNYGYAARCKRGRDRIGEGYAHRTRVRKY